MRTVNDIAGAISGTYPEESAQDWDNVGLLAGRRGAAVRKVLVALEVTWAVVDEARAGGFDMIVTHHPLIFRAIKSVTDDTAEGKLLLSLLEAGISLYSAHTNLDAAPNGIARKLADDLELSNVYPLLPYSPHQTRQGDAEYGFGAVGYLPQPMPFEALAGRVKKLWGIDFLRVAGERGKSVSKVAVLNGSGAKYLNACACQQADVYITGDCGHHDFDEARRLGVALIDAGHFHTEKYIPEILYQCLKSKIKDIEIRLSEHIDNPMEVY